MRRSTRRRILEWRRYGDMICLRWQTCQPCESFRLSWIMLHSPFLHPIGRERENNPGLTKDYILACLAYASYLAHEYKAYPIPA